MRDEATQPQFAKAAASAGALTEGCPKWLLWHSKNGLRGRFLQDVVRLLLDSVSIGSASLNLAGKSAGKSLSNSTKENRT